MKESENHYINQSDPSSKMRPKIALYSTLIMLVKSQSKIDKLQTLAPQKDFERQCEELEAKYILLAYKKTMAGLNDFVDEYMEAKYRNPFLVEVPETFDEIVSQSNEVEEANKPLESARSTSFQFSFHKLFNTMKAKAVTLMKKKDSKECSPVCSQELKHSNSSLLSKINFKLFNRRNSANATKVCSAEMQTEDIAEAVKVAPKVLVCCAEMQTENLSEPSQPTLLLNTLRTPEAQLLPPPPPPPPPIFQTSVPKFVVVKREKLGIIPGKTDEHDNLVEELKNYLKSRYVE
eukprot:NODE_12_length_54577_cov_0.384100.p21 type:complete len:291 gc:universal NODE_12_length_54577_cov_0.384100:16690-17562(+)